ncbi:MAG: peptidylprolyl isomerase [Humidesulfovibrio sp.]|uniref:peptidylprolyl isomerase n=1 Tax=Humidesulfovibrio sp. TaxID=2910988 RepID=UPI0027E799F9|nr:peptidylprolyl isomerase [Humidesulfovibrio sp.]MDQ7834086.1 peptidylprolyl isomerase [Humidesulfovibrio sp.]
MRKFLGAHAALLLMLLTALMAGCSGKSQDDVGVVAKVNGRPIPLEMLEYQYDLLHFDAFSGSLPTVGALREAYGKILGGLIALELVSQELEKRGQEVSDAELAEAEAKVRADYPDDAFDKMLAEEFIDLPMWRKHLRYACGAEKFQRLVLRPQIHLDYREIEAYYNAHIAAFRLPERVRLVVVYGPGRDTVEKALSRYLQQKDIKAVSEAFAGIQAREVTVAKDVLSPAWTEALQSIQPGKTAVVAGGRGVFEGLLLLERLPAETLDIAQAYSQVEAALVEERLQQAFDAWLIKALDASTVLVSQRLLHKSEDEDLPPEAPPAEAQPADQSGGQQGGQPGVASGNETG